jgi:GNAT superfamily N-acetyltransferase
MNLIEQGLGGGQYLESVTNLLIRIRAEEPLGGPWDAADLQWWSRSGHYNDPERLRFWSAPDEPISVCALFPTVRSTIAFTCLWTTAARDIAFKEILPTVLSKVQRIARDGRLTVDIEALDTDIEWRQFLECHGFQLASGGSTQAAVPTSNAKGQPWTGTGLAILDATQHTSEDPHPLERRLGAGIRRRLLACSLYRPELDLSVRTAEGDVVAYCICWVDPTNRFAMLEPMRTEQAWQRRGLGTALIAEQSRRLLGLGIHTLKVNYATDNSAAGQLYARSQFVARFRRLLYRWQQAPGDASV